MKRLLALLPLLLLLISCAEDIPKQDSLMANDTSSDNIIIVTESNDDNEDQNIQQSNDGITAIHVLAFNSEVKLSEGETSEEMYFTVDSDTDFDLNDIEFVSDNKDVAEAEYVETLGANCIFYTITAKKAGTATLYFADKNSSVRSEDITVTVKETKSVPAFEQTETAISVDTKTETTIETETITSVFEVYEKETSSECTYVLNTSSKKFHYTDCKSVPTIKPKNYGEHFGTRDAAIALGYKPCGNCKP